MQLWLSVASYSTVHWLRLRLSTSNLNLNGHAPGSKIKLHLLMLFLNHHSCLCFNYLMVLWKHRYLINMFVLINSHTTGHLQRDILCHLRVGWWCSSQADVSYSLALPTCRHWVGLKQLPWCSAISHRYVPIWTFGYRCEGKWAFGPFSEWRSTPWIKDGEYTSSLTGKSQQRPSGENSNCFRWFA